MFDYKLSEKQLADEDDSEDEGPSKAKHIKLEKHTKLTITLLDKKYFTFFNKVNEYNKIHNLFNILDMLKILIQLKKVANVIHVKILPEHTFVIC
jgi:hypothetical protein